MAKINLDIFERTIIQHTLKKDTAFIASIVEYVDKDIFKDANIGVIMDIIKTFYLERSSVPTLQELKVRCSTLEQKDALRGVVGMIRDMDEDYSEAELFSNTEYFIKQKKFSKLIGDAIDHRASEKEFDLDAIQRESEKIHTISLIDNLGLDYFGEKDRVAEYLLRKDNFISTGYASLDEAFGGGFMREGKAIYDIGGETNIGKSIFLANIALNVVLQDLNVVIISPEMSEMRYAKRITGMLTGIAIALLGENIGRYHAEVDRFVKKHKAKLIIKEVPTKAISSKNIQGYLTKLKEQRGFKPDLICVDGHALLKPSIPQAAKHNELQVIVQELRGLSYVFEAPILTVAQLNRGSHKASNPGLDNMAGSWDQLADFDAHVNIWQTDEDREANMIRFGGKKVRDGAGKGGEGFLRIQYDTLKLYEDGNIPSSAVPLPDTFMNVMNVGDMKAVDLNQMLS